MTTSRNATPRLAARLMAALALLAALPASARADVTPPIGAPSADPAATALPTEVLPVAHPAKVAAFLLGGVAVVGVGVGTAFGVLALHTKSQFDAHPTLGGAGTGNQEAVLADVSFGVALIAGVTSAVLFLKHEDPPPPDPTKRLSWSIVPVLGGGVTGAGAVVRF